MLIKASRITNLTDARYFAAKEVDYLGFNLEEGTEGFLDPMYMKAIREWVEGPRIIGEFSRLSGVHVAEAARFFALDGIQVSAEQFLAGIPDTGTEVIVKVAGDQEASYLEQLFTAAARRHSRILLDFTHVPGWERDLYERAAWWIGLLSQCPTLLEAGFNQEQIPELMRQYPFAGLSVTGGAEEQVGVKSFDELEEIFEALGR